MSTTEVVYFLRLSGRFGSSTVGAGALTGALPNSTIGAAGAANAPPSFDGIGSIVGAGAGATGAVYTGGCGTSGEGVIHCGCAGTLTSGAVPTPEIFPLLSPRSFLYHV